MSQDRTPKPNANRWGGLGQLTLVEHALCPLDTGQSLRKNLVFETGYYYADRNRHRRKAAVTVTCPEGLSPSDEFYLWGLLALTFAEAGAGGPADGEFHATPHFCLRRLGLVDQLGNRGGRQYQQFADALDRLAAVSYASDAFYDPVRAEHRRVRFRFLSYSLPLDPDSPRAWRIAWDPIFLDLVRPLGGHFRFDLGTYRSLDPAARRLFLLVSKIFDRRDTTPGFPVEHLAVDVLGFSPTLAPRHKRQKLGRVVDALAAAGVVAGPAVFERQVTGAKAARSHTVSFARGPRWDRTPPAADRHREDSPLWEGLLSLGFEAAAADRLLRGHPGPAVREWLDITLAARERFGRSFFRRSPQAYLVDNLKQAATAGRTPPDWWHELRSRERSRSRPLATPAGGSATDTCGAVLRRVTEAVFPAQAETPSGTPVGVPSVADILLRRR